MKVILNFLLLIIYPTFLFSQKTCFETQIKFCDNTRLLSVSQAVDGGFIAVGSRMETNSPTDFIITKITKTGEFLSPTIIGDTTMNYYAKKIIRTHDGNHLVLLSMTHWLDCVERVLLVKIDNNTNILWSKPLTKYDFSPMSISEDSKSNIRIDGILKDGCSLKLQYKYLVTDSMGTEIENTISEVTNDPYNSLGLYKLPNSNTIELKSNYSTDNLRVILFQNTTDTIWKVDFAKSGHYASFLVTDSNSVLILARDSRFGRLLAIRLINLSLNGKILLDTLYFSDLNTPFPSKILKTKDKNYIFCTSYVNMVKVSAKYDIKLIKVNLKGNIKWVSAVGADNQDDFIQDFLSLSDGYMVLAGENISGGKYPIFYRFDADGNILPNSKRLYNYNSENCNSTKTENPNQNEITLYPNPANDYIQIVSSLKVGFKYELFNINGTIVNRGNLEFKDKLNISKLNPGLYFIRVNVEHTNTMYKFIKN
jgi:hypothetical protein